MGNLAKIVKFILDAIFPISCLGCGREEVWLCSPCFKSIKPRTKQVCPYCFKKSPAGKTCQKCASLAILSGLLVAADYNNDLLQKVIHNFKYNSIKDLAWPLGRILALPLANLLSTAEKKEIVIMPVPLARRKLKARGFNQAELLTRFLTGKFRLTLDNRSLVRVKGQSAQAGLDHLARRRNIKSAFALQRATGLKSKTVILVDDVATTLATLEECAKALKPAQPRAVWAIVLARGK